MCDPLTESAWRVVNVYAYNEDEADVDMHALGEAITALHAALESEAGAMWEAAAQELDQARRPEAARIARLMAEEATVNPTATAFVTYPPESSTCANPDGPFPPGAPPPTTPGLPPTR